MKEKLFKPKKSVLIIFGLLVSPLIIMKLYFLSFSWYFEFEFFLNPIYISVFVIGLISIWIDKRFNVQIKRYVILFTVLLTIYVLLSYPIRDLMIKNSEIQGAEIGLLIEKYKIENGFYPENLDSDFFNEIPERSYVGSRFFYNKYVENDSNEICYITYLSFRGYVGSYYIEDKIWAYSSD